VNNLACSLLQLYVFALFGRAILSWFPLSPDGPMATVYSFLYTITEPVLAPLRRVIPPMGGFDISFLVVVLLIQVVVAPAIC
jgi:YggT family protein